MRYFKALVKGEDDDIKSAYERLNSLVLEEGRLVLSTTFVNTAITLELVSKADVTITENLETSRRTEDAVNNTKTSVEKASNRIVQELKG